MLLAGPAIFRGMQIFTPRRTIHRLPQNLLLAEEKHAIACF